MLQDLWHNYIGQGAPPDLTKPQCFFETTIQILEKALIELNAEIRRTHQFVLPNNRGIRNIIRICSINKCPHQYPRSIGKPKKKPLGY